MPAKPLPATGGVVGVDRGTVHFVTGSGGLLSGTEPNDDVAEPLRSERWRLVTMDTGHWPMFSQPRELVRLLLQTVASK